MTDLETIVSLAKRRGFVFPGSEIYGGLANTWDFGPLGALLKKNIKDLWWREFVLRQDNILPLDGGIILSPKVWEASGHVENFTDPLVECKKCHNRFRADQIPQFKNKGEAFESKTWPVPCPSGEDHNLDIETENSKSGTKIIVPLKFNGMFRTFIGATENKSSTAYLRPETAQAIFINFKNVLNSTRPKLPFGIAQIGKSFRNEITAGNFIFRDLEFEQMEIEYFVKEENWESEFGSMLSKVHNWIKLIGLDPSLIHEREHSEKERSHYSKKTVDIEFEYPFGKKELYGIAYRTDYDLKTHGQKSGTELEVTQDDGSKITPHVIEPSFGVERTFLAVLLSAYSKDGDRVVLKLKPALAPYKAAVFPLLANKPDLVKKAQDVFHDLKSKIQHPIAWDDRGNIGKRYFSQDEIGTPYCITIDFQTLEDDTVTIRNRDTAKQERVKIDNLPAEISKNLG